MKRCLFLLLSCVSLSVPAAGLWLPDAAAIQTQCAARLAAAQTASSAYLYAPMQSGDFLQLWNRIVLDLSALPTGLLAQVSPDEKIRVAAEACERDQTAFEVAFFTRPELYQRLQAMPVDDAIDGAAKQRLLEIFTENGVHLPLKQRVRVRQIVRELQFEAQAFQRALRENRHKLAFTLAELPGLSVALLQRQPRDAKGRYLFGFDYPEMDLLLRHCQREETRRIYRQAYLRRGGAANLARLDRIVALRAELAAQMSKADYATLAVARNMAGTPARVNAFLADVAERVRALEARDLADLTAQKRQLGGKGPLRAWDVRFYEDQLLKSKYLIDEAEVRRYFPSAATVDWALRVSGELYGIDFHPDPALARWHDEVRAYTVIDRRAGQSLGVVYLDLYPRAGKYKHAAAFGVLPVSTQAGAQPVSALVTNFSREGLNRDELRTLFHELGHVLHGVLSQTRYAFHAGTQVKRDFVEAPSQMFEHWVWRPEVLALMDQAPPAELLQKIRAAERFNRGFFYAGQVRLARFDMALHSGQSGGALALWRQIESESPLGHTPATEFPGTFAHVAGSYAAAYYGYLWSEVLARDMFSVFGGNAMNAEVGLRYRQSILARGGEVEAMQLVRDFLGREPRNDAFIRALSGEED